MMGALDALDGPQLVMEGVFHPILLEEDFSRGELRFFDQPPRGRALVRYAGGHVKNRDLFSVNPLQRFFGFGKHPLPGRDGSVDIDDAAPGEMRGGGRRAGITAGEQENRAEARQLPRAAEEREGLNVHEMFVRYGSLTSARPPVGRRGCAGALGISLFRRLRRRQ
jgi:hypothetical protein